MRGFTAIDRCDRCGAQARHAARKPGKPELLFCGHHHREHRDSLLNDYWLIESDESPVDPQPTAAYRD